MKNKKLLRVIVVALSVLLGSFVLDEIFLLLKSFHISIKTKDAFANGLISETFMLLLAVLLLAIFKRLNVLKPKVKGFGKGLLVGGVIVVESAIMLSVYFGLGRYLVDGQLQERGKMMASGLQVSLVVINMLFVGLAEEGMFRGLLQTEVLDYIGRNSENRIRLGIIITSILFGAWHITNAIHPDISLEAAFIQAVNAISLGILFGVIYHRSNNLWAAVVVHGLMDLSSFILSGNLDGVSQTEAIGTIAGDSMNIKSFIPFITMGILSLWLMRKNKLIPEDKEDLI